MNFGETSWHRLLVALIIFGRISSYPGLHIHKLLIIFYISYWIDRLIKGELLW